MFKNILKTTIFLITITVVAGYLYIYLGYRIIDCGKEKFVLGAPVDQWVRVSCYDGNHVITSTNSYRWEKSEKEVFLNARGYLDVIEEKNIFNNFSPMEFTTEGKIIARGAFGNTHLSTLLDYQVVNLNKDLSKEIGKKATYDTGYHLRVFSTAGFPYDIFIYVKDNKPEYIYSCINYCHVYPPEVIKIIALK